MNQADYSIRVRSRGSGTLTRQFLPVITLMQTELMNVFSYIGETVRCSTVDKGYDSEPTLHRVDDEQPARDIHRLVLLRNETTDLLQHLKQYGEINI